MSANDHFIACQIQPPDPEAGRWHVLNLRTHERVGAAVDDPRAAREAAEAWNGEAFLVAQGLLAHRSAA